ncbi:MAG: D-2-hydroxyacid dehydrogenase [Candidatus Marinimicrobia bacterium]|nr:D-2-hydroxyacid dehydrogenase [Candidatus Neomarinimicrobiota bacterium]
MKILITDGISENGRKILEQAGHECVIEHYEPEELIQKIPEFDAILVRSATKVPKEVIDAGKKLKVIARGGAGIDNIDHSYAKSLGIPVLNTPGANSASVAELALAHILALSRYIHLANVTMREGKWEKKKYKGIEVNGRILGIVGYGKIGRLLAEKAIALGMKVLVYDVVDVETKLPVTKVSLDELLEKSDFVSLHVPKMPKPLIDAEALKKMKKTAYLINCARGGVVDEKALLDALNAGEIAGAGLDVYEEEPTRNLELVSHPKVSVTPHVGASTVEAQDRVGIEIATKIVEALKNS